MKRNACYIALSAAMMMLTSCNHKELCFDHDGHVPSYMTDVRVSYDYNWEQPYDGLTDWRADWSSLGFDFGYDSLLPVKPEGIRMSAYNADGTRLETNMSADGEPVYLAPGENSLLFYNNDTEYIIFNDMGSYDEASATTRGRSRSSYKGNPYYVPQSGGKNNETTVSAPDVLFGHYIDSYYQNSNMHPQTLDITMHPLVFTYMIKYEFSHGYEYVALARGALSGMAGSVYLHNGRTSDKAVTILYDCVLKPWGIQAEVKSFGIPDFPNPSYSRGDSDFAVTLEVRLKNGKILNFYFNVTDQMRNQPHGGVIKVEGINISDSEGSGDSSGFDVSVDDWGEYEDVPVEL